MQRAPRLAARRQEHDPGQVTDRPPGPVLPPPSRFLARRPGQTHPVISKGRASWLDAQPSQTNPQLPMSKLPYDLACLKGGIHPIAANGYWTRDPAAGWIIDDLKRSGIYPAAAAANGLAFTSNRDRIAELLDRQTPLPGGCCLVIPYCDAAGNGVYYFRVKPERPRMERREGADR